VNEQSTNPNLITAVGTQVVTQVEIKHSNGEVMFPRGAVGVVVKAPVDNHHAYRVRFPNGVEESLKRVDFAIHKHFQREGLERDPLAEYNLYDHVIYRCVVGSRAYGLDEAGSDTDRRGIYLPPAELHWSLYGVPEQLENHETQESYWEVQKFITLALQANPNILECLYTPLVETVTPLAQELLDIRHIFLSKLIYQTYNGYVMSQFKKLNQHIQNHGTIKWKHAMHLIRLLLSGITVLNEGFVPVNVDAHRERLLAIRRGEVAWAEIDAWRVRLHQQFDAALVATKLPERPDYEQANAYLVKARRSMV
jgi:predicted nucleotidyltransferase